MSRLASTFGAVVMFIVVISSAATSAAGSSQGTVALNGMVGYE